MHRGTISPRASDRPQADLSNAGFADAVLVVEAVEKLAVARCPLPELRKEQLRLLLVVPLGEAQGSITRTAPARITSTSQVMSNPRSNGEPAGSTLCACATVVDSVFRRVEW